MRSASYHLSKTMQHVIYKSMSTITFDRLAYLETLKAAGIPEAQARAHAVALDEALKDTIATKSDVNGLEKSLRADMEILKRDLTIRMGIMQAASIGIIAALAKLV